MMLFISRLFYFATVKHDLTPVFLLSIVLRSSAFGRLNNKQLPRRLMYLFSPGDLLRDLSFYSPKDLLFCSGI